MISGDFGSFTTRPLEAKIDFYTAEEGEFATAIYSRERPYIVTMGLFTCKAVVIYSPEAQKGLLAHVAYTPDASEAVTNLFNNFGDGAESSNVQIVQTQQSDLIHGWPTVDILATAIAQYNPRSISIDHNPNDQQIRGVALDLANGRLHEAAYSHANEWYGSHDYSKSSPICPNAWPIRTKFF